MSLSSPQFFFAQDRALADEALPRRGRHSHHGTLRIGDTLTEARNHLCRRAQLRAGNRPPCPAHRRDEGQEAKEALQQMSEEGVVQVFRPRDGAPALVACRPLQLDVLKARLDAEYRCRWSSRSANFSWHAGFIRRPQEAEAFISANVPASPTTSTADRCSWPRTNSILGYTKNRRGHYVLQHQGREGRKRKRATARLRTRTSYSAKRISSIPEPRD